MNMITSIKNEKIKYFSKLAENRNILCLDNPKLIEEAIKCGYKIIGLLKQEDVEKVFTTEDIVVSDAVIKKFSNTKTSQGVVAFVEYAEKQLKKPQGFFLILDRVQDPGNVGTLIRSAVGSGFSDVYLISCASVTNSKTVRSTMGALFRTNIYEVDEKFLEILKTWKKTIYVADMDGDNIFEKNFEDNCGIIVGNEGQGVCDELIEIATNKLSIPMKNNLESLNAGVSGSIIMYQIANGGKNVRS